jgi:hypothetical protein
MMWGFSRHGGHRRRLACWMQCARSLLKNWRHDSLQPFGGFWAVDCHRVKP